ncbi:MAG: hypothetical protein RI897_2493 [Verrucomicrobiota bacterium]
MILGLWLLGGSGVEGFGGGGLVVFGVEDLLDGAGECEAGVIEERVEHGDDEQGKEGGGRHAADEAESEAFIAEADVAGGLESEGDHADDGGEGGHGDGAEAAFGGEEEGFAAFVSFGAEADDVIDEDDGVIDHDADEEDGGDGAEEVDIFACCDMDPGYADTGEGDGRDDGEGEDEAFEEEAHEEVDEHDGEAAGEEHAGEFVIDGADLGGAEGDAFGEVELLLEGEEAFAGFLGGGGVKFCGDIPGDAFIGAADAFGGGEVSGLGEGGEGDGIAIGCGDAEGAESVEAGSVGFLEADTDGDFAAFVIELGQGGAAEGVADEAGDDFGVNA